MLTSGLTVMTAMAGMLLAGNAVFISLGIGTILVVAVAVVGSVTVLPAVMARLGDGVEWGRVPFIARRRAEGRSRMWTWLVDRVLRRPAPVGGPVGRRAARPGRPALHMRTVDPGPSGLPRNLPIMQTYDRIEAAFPGAPMPALVVVTAKDVTAPAVSGGVARPEPSGPGQQRSNGWPCGGDGQLRPHRRHRHRFPRRQRDRSHVHCSPRGPA